VQAEKSKRDTVTLSPGQALRVEFQGKQLAPIKVVSLKLKTIDTSNPFASYQVPITVQVFEKNQLIGSESYTFNLGSGFRKIHVDVNNDPVIKGNYKTVIRFDNPEFSTEDNKVKIDLDTIKFNNGNLRMDLHGDLKIIAANG
jgi:hypothetical protein